MAPVPVFINCRDRVSCLRRLVSWLEGAAGVERIVLIDNDSTYAPLLDYYASSPHTVHRLGQNYGHVALWNAGVLSKFGVTGRFVYTDPDVVPGDDCPKDAIEHLSRLLDRHPHLVKIGLGLRIDDLPDHYKFKQEVLRWESQFWRYAAGPGLFGAAVDTSFALYRSQNNTGPAARTDHPYVARHESWYVNSAAIDDEERHYRSRATCTHWSREELPPALAEAVRPR